MISTYNILSDFKRSAIEVTSNISHDDIFKKYHHPYHSEKMPSNTTFKITRGKKSFDVIRLDGFTMCFYSQKIIDIISQFVDMSDMCYSINIEGVEGKYYALYNLCKYPFINKNLAILGKEPEFYCVNGIPSPIFSVDKTYCIVVSNEIKDALEKNKVTNIRFTQANCCSIEEYHVWKESNEIV